MKQDFSINDLGLATALVTTGCKLIRLDKTNSRKVRFVFESNKDTENVINAYWSDELKLPAQSLFNNQKMLKNRIYSDA